MLKNYFKIAIRNLKKSKAFSFINILGLTIGLACCMLIAAYVYDELSYDKYPEKAAQIYRIELSTVSNGGTERYPGVDIAVGQGMKDAFPEIQSFTRLLSGREFFVKYDDKQFKEQKVAFTDANFLQFFSIPCIKGKTESALEEPNSIVITKAFAKKYFGDAEPMGKALIIGNGSYKVTGLIDKVPDNSHFHYDAFVSMSSMHLTAHTWSNIGFYTYVVLNKNADPARLEAKFPGLVAKYVVPEIMNDMGVGLAEAQKSVNTFIFSLQPLSRIHLFASSKYELEANADMKYIYIFSALAVFILLLACINFTNLSTARSATRAREIGIRKVMGSEKKQLVAQFLIESLVLAWCAVIFAVGIVYLVLPFFNQLAGKQISFSFFYNYQSVIIILLLGTFAGILAGIYPAFFLSAFNTIRVLKSASATGTNYRSPMRTGLVVFQFAVSTGLIIATIIVYQQLHYMQDKKLGYEKEQVLYLQDMYVIGNRDVQTAFKESLLKDNRIINASVGTDVPGNPSMDGTEAYPKEKREGETGAEIHINIFHVDYDYIPTLGIKMAAGRNFSRAFRTDSFAVVINEAAVRDLGWSGTNPIGKTIISSGQHSYNVIGVMSDFHYASVKQKIAPLMMRLGTGYRTGLIVKVKTADIKNLLADIKKQWDATSPGSPFSYYFLDNKFAALYSAEQKTGQIFSIFSIVAIVIACMGLFGLATYSTQQRAKEIGIRKIFGASVQDVLLLVAREFLLLVGVSLLIAIPVTWWGMHKWLLEFAYRIPINGWIFLAAGIIALMIALATISFHTIKAALANPVKSLRAE